MGSWLLSRLVGIGAWVVLGLFGLKYLYTLTSDDFGSFENRFFGGLPELGTGIFYAGLLLVAATWLERQGR